MDLSILHPQTAHLTPLTSNLKPHSSEQTGLTSWDREERRELEFHMIGKR